MLLPRDDTNAYRLVNGEGDRMSGVGILSVAFHACACLARTRSDQHLLAHADGMLPLGTGHPQLSHQSGD